jgi:hypothetical protein
VDALAAIRDPTAFVQLGALARSASRGVSRRAEVHLRAFARELGLDAGSLEEVLLPDLGLDERGARWLDYGSRRFEVLFDGALEPALRDEGGARLPTLPRPRASDDADQARAAAEAWKVLRKEAQLAATTLRRRADDGMRRRRRWSVRQVRWLVSHPFGRHLYRRLLWRSDGVLLRFDEQGAPVDDEDRPVELRDPVELPHPVDLGPEVLARWAQVFADYELVQPVEQLARAVHRAERADLGSIARLTGSELPRAHLFALQARGWSVEWERDELGQRTGAPLAAVADWAPGVRVLFEPSPGDTLRIGAVRAPLAWTHVDPLVFSEVVRDLTAPAP